VQRWLWLPYSIDLSKKEIIAEDVFISPWEGVAFGTEI
jgi:hypothetical protein